LRCGTAIGFMSDDGKHVSGGNHFGRGACDHVGQKRLAADFMQHLGMFWTSSLVPYPPPVWRWPIFREARFGGYLFSAFDPIYREKLWCRAGLGYWWDGWCGADTLVRRFWTLIPVSIFNMPRLPRTRPKHLGQVKGGGQECPPPHCLHGGGVSADATGALGLSVSIRSVAMRSVRWRATMVPSRRGSRRALG